MKVYLLITDGGDNVEVSAYATRKLAEDEAANIMRDELDGDAREDFDKVLAESSFSEAEQVYEENLASGSFYVRVDEVEVRG